MAMTKKEREAFDAALKKAEVLGALRWTALVVKDVPIPKEGYSEGWIAYSNSVQKSWSAPHRHGNGCAPAPGDMYKSAIQKGVSMYSTRLLALKALRNNTEKESAEELRRIDLLIAKEEEEE